MKVRTWALALGLATFLVCFPASAWGKVITVHPGQSIQAAIDKAHSGDTVKLTAGTFHENVQIKTDGIDLVGSGENSTTLEPAASASPVCGAGADFVPGICVADADQSGNPVRTVKDVEVSNLTVNGFPGVGVFFLGTSDIEARHITATNDGEYGIFALQSSKIEISHDSASGNGEAGIYVGESPQANADVEHNDSTDNTIGLFIRDSANGEVEHNSASGNCIGILFLNTGAGESNWKAEHNSVVANDKPCPASEEESATSGVGIAVAGASDIWISHNVVRNNKPGGPTDFSGGILVAAGDPNTPPSNVHVTDNVALGNEPNDLFWDQSGTGIVFDDNVCKTSDPAGLCEHGGGEQHGGGGGDNDNQGGNGQGNENGAHPAHHKHHKHKHHKRHKHHHHD